MVFVNFIEFLFIFSVKQVKKVVVLNFFVPKKWAAYIISVFIKIERRPVFEVLFSHRLDFNLKLII